MIEINNEQIKQLRNFIHKQTGIYFEDKKLDLIKKKIKILLQKYNFSNFSSFYHQIRFAKNEELIQELISTITVNETYFWREHEQFKILANDILPEIAKVKNRIRILVAPVSSGEELYSIMFAILEEKNIIENNDIEIIGIDIDSKMVNKAKKGVYTKRSIDKLPKDILSKYFKKDNDLYYINKDFINSSVIIQANIFDNDIIDRLGIFDIIFSRNMLIYFNNTDKQKAFLQFYNLLNQNGYLFLGHADANLIDKKFFKLYKNGLHIYKKI